MPGKTTTAPKPIKPYRTKKGEAYMSQRQLEHFHSILIQSKSELTNAAHDTLHSLQDETINTVAPDILDRAAQEEEFNNKLQARRRELNLIKKIDEALEHIQTEEYGYCTGCSGEIGIQRLEARPTATQCIDCKTLAEIREQQTER